ncbi:MAG: GNAT family N-acetyltransferase [Thermoleophilaceae bacterium]|nr:GNAT family N-acetyltransferase [Thermoleophilaceae bacterium]
MRVRLREEADADAVAAFLSARGMRRVARDGELLDALDHPALIAEDAGRLEGVATFIRGSDSWELLTLHARVARQGTGTALVEALARAAADEGAALIRVTTTNDNLDALRFYQRRGFRLRALRAGAVDESRERFKAEIPSAGDLGIPLRDEIELEKPL